MGLAANLEYANLANKYIKEHCPYGGLNRKDVFERDLCGDISHQQLSLFGAYRRMHFVDVETSASLQLRLKGGFCGELMFIAGAYLKACIPELQVEPVHLDNHTVLVIGRIHESDPKDINTWGENAVICDPWAQLSYPASDFLSKQNGPDIPFYTDGILVVLDGWEDEDEIEMGSQSLILNKQHYLSGNPDVWCQLSDSPIFIALRDKVEVALKKQGLERLQLCPSLPFHEEFLESNAQLAEKAIVATVVP